MPKFDALFTDQNRRLFDMYFRQQVYLEGFKQGLISSYVGWLRDLHAQFARLLLQNRYQTMDQFTKAELSAFIYAFKAEQAKGYNIYAKQLIETLQAFMAFDVDLTEQMMELVTGKSVTQVSAQLKQRINPTQYAELDQAHRDDYVPNASGGYTLSEAYQDNARASGVYGIAILDDNNKLWATITNAPVPASGQLMLDMIDTFSDVTDNLIYSVIQRGYANAWNKQQMNDAMFGADPAQGAGLFARISNQYSALLATIVQHVSSEVQSAVASVYFEKYQWCSVMDSHTTQICIDRNGNIYVYGEGPLPPAWWRCRSKTVPVQNDVAVHSEPESFGAWLVTQPDYFLTDVLTPDELDQLKGGKLASLQVSQQKPLTLTQLQGKVKYILGD